MKKLVIDATEGGAYIKGTERMSLANVIKKYCQNPINKSQIKPLLTLAPDGDELIARAIPLLEDDIEVLTTIATNSRKGLAASYGLKNLLLRPQYKGLLSKQKAKQFDGMLKKAEQQAGANFRETNHIFFKNAIVTLRKSKLRTVMILSYKNLKHSEIAHVESAKNPLVNVAIYGATRAIQSRRLKVKETLTHFLRNIKDAKIRIERNILILKATRNASLSLRKSYKETLKLLKEYDKTKDNALLVPGEAELIDLADSEKYFAAGNWAHPLLDALKAINNPSRGILEYSSAKRVRDKALAMREKAISVAKIEEGKNADREERLLRYNQLLKESKLVGRKESDFDKALELLQEAAELMPEETEARWGMATALHHAGDIEKSLEEYEKLIKDFPDNLTFKFEYGQVLLRNEETQKGLKVIGEVMSVSDDFDNFLARLGEIYEQSEMLEEALIAYTSYLKKFPYNYEIWYKKGDCLSALGRKALAKKAYAKADEIKPK